VSAGPLAGWPERTKPDAIRVAVVGAAGRMGTLLVQAIDASSDLVTAARVDLALAPAGAGGAAPDASAGENTRIGAGGVSWGLASVAAGRIDVAVEFTRGDAPERIGPDIEKLRCAWVSGTTGLTPASRAALESAARSVPVLWSPNMSLGVALVRRMLRVAAELLPTSWELEIVETHHGGKLDAPSGTALSLAEVWTGRRGGEQKHGRSGLVGKRPAGEVGIHAVRLPEGVGEHRCLLGGPSESIELTHRVSDRAAFVRGTLTALRWLAGREPGLYTLDHCVDDLLR